MSDASKSKARRPRLGRGLSSLIVNSSADAGAYEPAAEPHPADQPPDVERDPAARDANARSDTSPDASRDATDADPDARPDTSQPDARDATDADPAAREQFAAIALDDIAANPYQPRQDFDADALATLTESIRRQGLLQPLVVARAGDAADRPYRLIAGERRLRAARQAGLDRAPCIVRDATDEQLLEWALIENIHRAELNPIERAEAYRRYIDRFALTQSEVAERLAQPRATVANYLRMLDLEESVRAAIAAGQLSFGHAKVLASLAAPPERQRALARRAIRQQLSVRRLEAIAAGDDDAQGQPRRATKAAYLRDLEEQLTHAVGTRVAIQPGRKKNTGRVIVEFYGLDDFDRICEALGAKLQS
ncbi:MAG: ParB/RepB/Spo0J family partition protein [Phycisphaerae bacterium]|nr:ParB/RepB/Spo0J family partition protein [Phycisphaerae bacterium]